MSIDDIYRVRDRITGLFMNPEQALTVAPPDGFFGVSEVVIFGGSTPLFIWDKAGVRHKAWLKLCSWKPPYWDFQIDEGELVSLGFGDLGVQLPVALMKAYSRHFPFRPTDNYYINGGEFVA